ncbi:hypothetical protein NPIL_175101 [Nephila pilipes]|uniref:Uncharacterized protein n=1 Tax=Nephila pilipes TaxID=299642 RepID=A0A8X6N2B6_NEPPI|nr:hypothetical protein NPIL_175101 [Nephila pilipes]
MPVSGFDSFMLRRFCHLRFLDSASGAWRMAFTSLTCKEHGKTETAMAAYRLHFVVPPTFDHVFPKESDFAFQKKEVSGLSPAMASMVSQLFSRHQFNHTPIRICAMRV